MSTYKKVLLAVTAVIVFIGYLSMVNRLSTLQNQLVSVQNQLASMQSSITGFNGQINMIQQRDQLIAQHDYGIKNVNNEYVTAEVTVSLRFNKLPNDSKVSLLYKSSQKDNDWTALELKHLTGLNYAASLTLSYEEDYIMEVLIEGDEEKISEQLSPIRLKSSLAERISMEAHPTNTDSKGNVRFNVHIGNFYQEKDALKLASAHCLIYYKDNLIADIDILKDAEKRELPGLSELEQWSYDGSIKVEGVSDLDYMEDMNFKIIAIDGLGKEYTYIFPQH